MGGDSRHVFLAYEDDAEFLERAAPLLRKGLDRGELVVYASDADAAEVRRHLGAADGGSELVGSANFTTEPLRSVYSAAEDPSPGTALTNALRRSLERARARDLAGLRVFGISTQLASFAHWGRWEFEVGRRVVDEEVTAICAYDATAVDRAILGDLAALHQEQRSRRPFTSFSLYPTLEGLALTGEVDAMAVPRLERALACVEPGPRRLEIDVSGLTFLNHTGLLTIEAFARRQDLHVGLVGASGTVRKLHDVLGLDRGVIEVKP